MKSLKWSRYGIRFACWLAIAALLATANYLRGKIDVLEIKAENAFVCLYVFPTSVGAAYLAEIYPTAILDFKSDDYADRPYRLGGHFDGFEKAPVPAPPLGKFAFHYVNNGGPHWTLSFAIPNYAFVVGIALVGPLLRLPKGLRKKNEGSQPETALES